MGLQFRDPFTGSIAINAEISRSIHDQHFTLRSWPVKEWFTHSIRSTGLCHNHIGCLCGYLFGRPASSSSSDHAKQKLMDVSHKSVQQQKKEKTPDGRVEMSFRSGNVVGRQRVLEMKISTGQSI